MNKAKIFKKALDKAVKNGWQDNKVKLHLLDMILLHECYFDSREHWRAIFDHDFAKAFWGTRELDGDNFECHEDAMANFGCEEWQWRLQQMVLYAEPLEYIKTFL